ncbi:hypothetical protein SAY86_014978 [Trapa natans]|uniref:Ionotropic glutamate receptor C-terminal domain-containing protein n=1 Tax=Trapa natans TaxID=22666 RepID=A0AAN7KM72_TRANT|nr:hypothetical protein SAY86_014978 [Trapa natans]
MEVHIFGAMALILFLHLPRLAMSHGSSGTKDEKKVLHIGVILDFGSLLSNESRIALDIARRDFSAHSRGYKLKLHYENSGGKPVQAVSSAGRLIKSKKVMAIIGPETWKTTELVAELANQFQVPTISLARNPSGSTTPGLIEMGNDGSKEIKCIANIVQSYNRRRVVTIYEEDAYNDNHSLSLYLSLGLQDVGSEIEDRVVFPPFSSLVDPESGVKEKLRKFRGKPSPVFVLLDLSLPMAGHLFREADRMGLFRGDSIWILSVKLFSLLVSAADPSIVMPFAKAGCANIGLVAEADLPNVSNNRRYSDFSRKFRSKAKHKAVGNNYMNYMISPGIHALRAYDSLTILTNAVIGASTTEITDPEFIVKRVLSQSRSFDGLSGKIAFKDGRMLDPGKVGLVSMLGASSKWLGNEVKVQSCEQQVLCNINSGSVEDTSNIGYSNGAAVTGRCFVQPDVHQSHQSSMKIVVPSPTPLDKFVKEMDDSSGSGGKTTRYAGFCIDVFNEILSILNRSQTFVPDFHSSGSSTYDNLVESVHNKTYEAAVGDITILADRSKIVEFTQPFIESGLSMIVVEGRDEKKTWIFLKPFTPTMWMATGSVLICTMLTVWFLEQPVNPEFRGPWKNQLATALWFTFSSLFLAHRERIYRNLTRTVIVVWLFMALILTQSYTASLTSMLTVQRLKPNEITMEWLKQHNSKVGCDDSTFLCHYLESVHNFSRDVIVGISNYTEFYVQLKSGRIKAAFMEYPYERAFLSLYCKGFSVTHQSYRFGGFGFVFQNGSSWTAKFSEAILELSESGKLKRISDLWFNQECLTENASTSSDPDTHSLGLDSFWALYIFSLGTSMLCMTFSMKSGNAQVNINDQLEDDDAN